MRSKFIILLAFLVLPGCTGLKGGGIRGERIDEANQNKVEANGVKNLDAKLGDIATNQSTAQGPALINISATESSLIPTIILIGVGIAAVRLWLKKRGGETSIGNILRYVFANGHAETVGKDIEKLASGTPLESLVKSVKRGRVNGDG